MDKPVNLLKFTVGAGLFVVAGSVAAADFSLNFKSDPNKTAAASYLCNRDGAAACRSYGNYLSFEPTPFLMEEVDLNGVNYIHFVVGDPATGFAQEVFLEGTNGTSVTTYNGASVYSPAENDPNTGRQGLGPLTGPGNGSANPEKVVVRQVIGGEWDPVTETWSCGAATFCNEFLKDTLLTKPRITQTVIDGAMTSFFDMDMRTIGYSQPLADQVAAPVINTVTLQGVDTGNFAMTPAYIQDSTISGGRFVYTPGTGNRGSEGTYSYAEGDFDTAAEDWTIYRDPDPAVNPDINL